VTGAALGAGLEGRGVIVTGAAGGIGRAVCAAFADAGARVLATDLEQGALDELVARLDGEGHLARAADLRDLEGHAGLVAAAVEAFGGVYALIHVAAVIRRQYDIDEVTEADWDFQHDVNLKASFFLCRAAGNAMAAGGRGGRIVTFTSQAWQSGGMAGSIAYSATKGGIVTLTRGLARTYASAGITVNTISPGSIETPMITENMDPVADAAMRSLILLGRRGEPDEIAPVAVFLASDHARYITGATLNVSGGMLLY
jgi:NAD(P)-dependent dehydrogenase (short-subunit alcohol dehydrogenase family)